MSVISTKLFMIREGDDEPIVCSLYDSPTDISDQGEVPFEVNVAGGTAYLALSPVSTDFDSYQHINLNGIDYIVQTQVGRITNFNINQSEHQTISVIVNGERHNESFSVVIRDFSEIRLAPAEGYTAGNLIMVYHDPTKAQEFYTLQAESATLNQYLVTIPQMEGQTIRVRINDGENAYFNSFTANHFDRYQIILTAQEGYTAGKLLTEPEGIITGPLTIECTDATLNQFFVNIRQSEHQIITVTTDDGVEHTEGFYAPYGTKYTAVVVADTGYNPGVLSSVSGTVTGTFTISATSASAQQFYIRCVFDNSECRCELNGNIINPNTIYNFDYGTEYTLEVFANLGYHVSNIDKS